MLGVVAVSGVVLVGAGVVYRRMVVLSGPPPLPLPLPLMLLLLLLLLVVVVVVVSVLSRCFSSPLESSRLGDCIDLSLPAVCPVSQPRSVSAPFSFWLSARALCLNTLDLGLSTL